MEHDPSNLNNSLKRDESLADRLWLTIDQIHMSYLELEEGPDKIEQRSKLEAFIREFLCLVPHNQKFTLPETYEVFHRSVANKKDFSGYKAATGWNTIQMYAGNLLSQPWRQEYYQIKVYCGFYKHQIDANLTGAEKMFEALGYKQKGDGIFLIDEPICPDRLANVSRDCIFAYVECEILKNIWEEVSPMQSINWFNILEFRSHHICSVDQCIRALKCLWNQKEVLCNIDNEAPLVSLSKIPKNQTLYSQKLSLLSGIPSIYYKSPCNHTYPSMPLINHSVPIQITSNGYYHASSSGQNKPSYAIPSEIHNKQIIKLDKSQDPLSESSRDGYEDWGYVFRNLEDQGYSKDLGERGDILSLNAKQEKDFKTKLLNNKQQNQIDKRDVSPNEKLKKPSKTTNLLQTEKDPSMKNKWECPSCTFMNTKVENSVCEMCSKSRYPVNSEPPMEIGGAECSKCTLVNPKTAKHCMACSNSLENSPTYI